jgi:hypothetical protein
LLLRICADLQLFNLKKFAKLSEMEVGILKQLEGWKKQY